MRVTDFGDFQQRAPAIDGGPALRAPESGMTRHSDASALGTNQLPQHAPVVDLTPLAAGDDIADNITTTTSISVGGTLNSSIQTSGDLDYISISLVAGHAYTFSLDFAGTGFSSDGYLELRDSTGALVAQNDDGGNALDSFVVYTAAQTGTFFVVARGFDGGTTGAYTLTTDEIATGQTSPTTFVGNGLPYFSWEEAAIQISRSGDSWATALNTPAVITYAYRASAPASMPDDTAGFSTFSAAQIAATEAALAAWASIANITFVRVNDGAGYSNNATMLFGNYSSGADGAAAFAYLPTTDPVGGDVWVNISLSDNSNLTPGGYGNQVLLHEIGHALGLSHPGDYNAGQGNPAYPGSAVFYGDTRMFTIMSYFASVNTGGVYSSYASLPQVFDIAAIQRLYGANTSTRVGDTVYGFNSNTGISQYSLAFASSQAIFTIWDGGGNDTLDLSLYTTSSLIDLREESFSTAGPRTGGTQLAAYNIAIAHGVVIENAIGGSGDDTIIGNSANNVLDGRGGFDVMRGGLGDDTYYGNNLDTITEDLNAGTDTLISSTNITLFDNVENLVLTGTALTGTGNALDNVITGNENNNTLNGGAGNDTLDGGAGADTMVGGLDNDTYYVDNAGDVVTEALSEGTDIVHSSLTTYTLTANVEVLILDGGALNGAGNALNNAITGNAVANMLDGGAGADAMAGGGGDDTYIVDNAGDVVTELAAQGADTVQASITHTLSVNIENLTLVGSANTNATGNGVANTLIGNNGNNVINGGGGADAMSGGAGNDYYVVDNVGDTITELNGEGTDTVQSTVSFTLSDYVERLLLSGSGNINATGSAQDNTMWGNTGNNIMNGGLGADVMYGSAGDDTYIVDNVADVTAEGVGNGTDTVMASVTYYLYTNLENLTLTGSANINGNGNTQNNIIIGNSGNNVINGGTGADAMSGGAGNDYYVVDNVGDTITELNGEGTDTVQSTVSFTISDYVERLLLSGSGNINATGSAQDNLIWGNGGNNIIDGGLGADTLTGGGGADTFVFSSALGSGNVDGVADLSVVDDTILLNNSIFTGLSSGALDTNAFVIGAAAADADDRIIYNSATGQLYFDADGNDVGAAVLFANLTPGLALTSADFIVGGP